MSAMKGDKPQWNHNNQEYATTGRSEPKEQTLFSSMGDESSQVESASKYKPKDRVIHPKYGIGRVVSIEGSGDNLKLSIIFDSAGLKTFMEKYTPLEKMQ